MGLFDDIDVSMPQPAATPAEVMQVNPREVAQVAPQISQAAPIENAPAAAKPAPSGLFGDINVGAPTDMPYEGPTGRLNKMNPELWDKFTQMALDFQQATGRKLGFTDTFRTHQEQIELKQRKPTLAATPGQSRHEYGEAIDVRNSDVPDLEKLGLLDKYGFIRPALHKGETWHIEQPRGPIDKAKAHMARAAAGNPMMPLDLGAGMQTIAPVPLPQPMPPIEQPIEPASWQNIQDPFAASIALTYQHPEESMDPFARGFYSGVGWGLTPESGESKRAFGVIPANMYAFGHDVGMLLPVMASFGLAAAPATAIGATGMGTGLGAEILTPFVRSVLGGSIYGGGEKINEFVAAAAQGKPLPNNMEMWGQFLGNAYNHALGFALVHAGVNATFGELGHYLSLRNFRKQMVDPIIKAAGSPEALQAAAQADPSLSNVASKSPEAAQAVNDLNAAAQRKFNDDIGTIVNQYGQPITEATKALEIPSWRRNAIEKLQAESLERDRLAAFQRGEPAPAGGIIPGRAEYSARPPSAVYGVYPGEPVPEPPAPVIPAYVQRAAGNPTEAELVERGLKTPTPTIASREIVQPAASGEAVSAAPEAKIGPEPVATANAISDSADAKLLDIVQKVPATREPEIAFATAVSEGLDIPLTDADNLIQKAVRDGLIRFSQRADGLVAVPGPKVRPTAIQIKSAVLPEGLAPKAIAEPDGTTWNQAGVWLSENGGLRHEFYVVNDPQTQGGYRFVEKIYKGDQVLSTNTLFSGDIPTMSRHMENTMHSKWENAYRFKLGEVGGQLMYNGMPVDQFVPALKRLAPARQMELLRNVWKELTMSLAPESISKEGQIAAQGLREYHARLKQGIGQRENAWEAYRQDFDKMTPEERQAFISGPLRNYETTGEIGDPAYRPVLQAYKEACDKMIAAIEETTGKTFPYREHYFRHMWDDDPVVVRAAVDMFEAQGKAGYYDPVEIRQMVDSVRAGQPAPSTEAIHTYVGNRSLEGSKAFLRPRKIPTMADGISWGLKSASDNPVDIIMMDLMQKHRYLLGQKLFKQLKDERLVKFSSTADIPAGWQPIEDKIAQVWYYVDRPGGAMILEGEERPIGGGPERAGFTEVPAVKGFMQGGKYYAPPEVAAIINRDLSPGLRGSALYQLYRTPTDMLNAIAVGWSGFHWQFETISDMAIGFGRGAKTFGAAVIKGDAAGMAKGVKDMVINQPLALPYKVMSNVSRGTKIIEEGLRSDFAGIGDISGLDARSLQMADFVVRAGGRFGTNKPLVQSLGESLSNALTDALHIRPLKTAKDLTELVSKPLMEWYVPRVKLACFSRLLEGDLESTATKMGRALSETEQSLVAMNTWQHIDNIFGQLVYDNLHMNKAFRDMIFMFVRFPGWNIGSLRTLTGTGRGITKLATGKPVDYQAQAAMEYAFGLCMNLGILGTLTNVALAGSQYRKEHPEASIWECVVEGMPKSAMDVYMPRTGRLLPDSTPERIWYASYLRDAMGFVVQPMKEILKGNPLGAPGALMQTITAKEAPGLRLAYEFLTNKNYFGEQIFTPGAGAGQQALEFGKHVGSEYLTPFGIQQAMKARGGASAIANVLGTTSVPRRYLRSPAQDVISEYNSLKRGTETRSEAEKSQYKQDFLDALRTGDLTVARDVAQEAVQAMKFSQEDIGRMLKEAREQPIVHGFRGMPLEWALKAYSVADENERRLLGPTMVHKLQSATLMEKMRLKNEIQSVFADVQAKREAARKVTTAY